MSIKEPASVPAIALVKISEIKVAPWNPKSRISERRLTQLRISMDDLGLYYPVLIDTHNNLVDGHRRLAIAKSFGWTRIPAITTKEPISEAYGSVQLTQQKLTGNDRLGVYLIEPNALIGSHRNSLKNIEKRLGRWAIELLYKSGMSQAVFSAALGVVKYTKDAADLETVFRWIVKHRMTMVFALMRGEMPAAEILRAIKADKPIKIE
jgi:hypothetical protein